MKQCPICQSLAFDDAVTCFGCLHEFSADDPILVEPASATVASEVAFDIPPAFVIQIRPEREHSGQTSWTCTVDLVPA